MPIRLKAEFLCPALPGSSLVRGGRLRVRTPAGEIDVNAPASLLRLVFEHCDGTRTMPELLARLPASTRDRFQRFVSFLLDRGALIDANHLTAHVLRVAYQASPFGLAEPTTQTDLIARRFSIRPIRLSPSLRHFRVARTPLLAEYRSRITTYTFDDRAATSGQLIALLWSLAGVVRSHHERLGREIPRRTLGSAGSLHLVRITLALRRAVGSIAPGFYRVHYAGERNVSLERLSTDIRLLPRAFTKPWVLEYATGAVFLTADERSGARRYRNRALQYLFMEAGASLHNGALSAPALGLGYAILGAYYEVAVASQCQTGGHAVLGSAVFGASPSRKQLAQWLRTPEPEFAWSDQPSAIYQMPFFMARARFEDEDAFTWGRDTDARLACRKALAEAIERRGYAEPRGIARGKWGDFDRMCHPDTLACYDNDQYALPGFPYARFSARRVYPWATGLSVSDGKTTRVPAELVFIPKNLEPYGRKHRPLGQMNSSGCAAGETLEDALRRALLEVIERDAFMRHWLSQSPGRAVRDRGLPATLRSRLRRLREAGCTATLVELQSDWATVFLAAAQHHGRSFTAIGAAAGPQAEVAADAALGELESRVFAWLHDHEASALRVPADVSTPEHHFELYRLKAFYRRADRFLFPSRAGDFRAKSINGARLQTLCDAFLARGIEPLYVDITPKSCYIDQGRTRLTVVRALVPSMIPVSFGFGREPRGMVERVHPDSKFPHPFP